MSADCDFAGPGPWKLPVVGFTMDTLWFTYPMVVLAYGDGGKFLKTQLNGRFEFRDPAIGDRSLDAEKDSWDTLAALFALRGDRISQAGVSTASALHIEFASGRALIAAPEGRDEGWEVSGPGFKIVGAANEPAIWAGKAWEQ